MKRMNMKKVEVMSNVNLRQQKGFRSTMGDRMGKLAMWFFNSTQILVIALGFFVMVYLFVASFSVIDGPSMLPNFETGDLTIYEKITTTWGTLHRGDVIVFLHSDGKDFIKRVIGLPGDTILIQDGKVHVNDIAIKEDYLSDDNKYVLGGTIIQERIPVRVPAGNYAVFGDNRKVSLDSRNIGFISQDKIKGKVWVVFWPLSKVHFVNHVRYTELGDR